MDETILKQIYPISESLQKYLSPEDKWRYINKMTYKHSYPYYRIKECLLPISLKEFYDYMLEKNTQTLIFKLRSNYNVYSGHEYAYYEENVIDKIEVIKFSGFTEEETSKVDVFATAHANSDDDSNYDNTLIIYRNIRYIYPENIC